VIVKPAAATDVGTGGADLGPLDAIFARLGRREVRHLAADGQVDKDRHGTALVQMQKATSAPRQVFARLLIQFGGVEPTSHESPSTARSCLLAAGTIAPAGS
jgi:hypothetical protein